MHLSEELVHSQVLPILTSSGEHGQPTLTWAVGYHVLLSGWVHCVPNWDEKVPWPENWVQREGKHACVIVLNNILCFVKLTIFHHPLGMVGMAWILLERLYD